ncbi:unnamed protein product [Penicillium palitans]
MNGPLKSHDHGTSSIAHSLRTSHGSCVPELPRGDDPKAKVSRQAKRRLNKRIRPNIFRRRRRRYHCHHQHHPRRRAFPSHPNHKSRVMAMSPQSKKDRDKPLGFQQPLAFRPKNGTTVAESPSETLSLTLRPKEDRA